MDEKIDPGLFARLMRLSPGTRSDILEYLGQGPVSSQAMLGGVLPAPSVTSASAGLIGASTQGKSVE
ncbi:hypothetical protein LSUCC0031_12290 [Rhodobacterales bacterium LSUCC0031]|nr:hypothetical protein [Rhodobacterales bacterium LSUCC0031]